MTGFAKSGEGAGLPRAGVSFVREVLRYGVLLSASMMVSAANLALQLAALRILSAEAFGTLALILLVVQFGFGISNAMTGAPLAALLRNGAIEEDVRAGLAAIDLLLATALAIIGGGIAGLFLPWWAAVGLAAFCGLSMVRWSARSVAYATLRPVPVSISDALYAVVLLVGVVVTLVIGAELRGFVLALIVASVASLVPLGAQMRDTLQITGHAPALRRYRKIWDAHARWALAGVVTTEATSHGHAYLVALSGPAAFAPIASAMLLLRPALLLCTMLTQIERPPIARALAQGDADRVQSRRRWVRGMLLAGCAVNAMGIAIVLHTAPWLLFQNGSLPAELLPAAVLWGGAALLICVQTPLSITLQAGGRFRPLTEASLISAPVALLLAAAALLLFGPVFSLLGILAGHAVLTWRLRRADDDFRPAWHESRGEG